MRNWIGVCSILSFLTPQSGQSSELADRLNPVLEDLHNQHHISGSLSVLANGEQFYRGVGLANDLSGAKNDEKTIFLTASNSKQFAAATIVYLEEQGKLKTSDKLSLYLPEYPIVNLTDDNGAEVTIEHLLQHTSGVPDAYEEASIKAKLFREKISFADILNAIKEKPLVTPPGSTFAYSNTGYILLGEVIRRATGRSFKDVLENDLLKPHQLADTTVGPQTADAERTAPSYERDGNGRQNFIAKKGIKETHVDDTFTDGSVFSTVSDLTTWITDLALGKVLSPSSTKKIFSPSKVRKYGYGWIVGRDSAGRSIYTHWGAWLGYMSFMSVFPDDAVTVVWLANQSMDEDVGTSFYEQIVKAALP